MKAHMNNKDTRSGGVVLSADSGQDSREVRAEPEAARARYLAFYDLVPVGYCTISDEGLIMEANPAAAALLGLARSALVRQPITTFILPDDRNIYSLHREQPHETHSTDSIRTGPELAGSGQAGTSRTCELRMLRTDAAPFWVRMEIVDARDADGTPLCHVVMSDITERKIQERERELMACLTAIVNTPGDIREHISTLAASLQEWAGCDAIGIRLSAGDDYPYYWSRGFSPAFVRAENRLSAYDRYGRTLRDGANTPVLVCMCGNVLSGRFDPTKPFFTAHGSFWSNSARSLFASIGEVDRLTSARIRCAEEGYESLALIPMRAARGIFGLLQFNDHQKNRFSPELIAHFERIADNMAIALSQRRIEMMLQESEEKYMTLFDNAGDAIFICDEGARILAANPRACERLGYTHAELLSMTIDQVNSEEEAPRAPDRIALLMERGHLSYETAHRRRDGSLIPTDVNARRITWDGRPAMMSICRDIGERKQVELALRASEARLRQLAMELSRVEERERRRLAASLHDEIAQALALLRIKLGILATTLDSRPAQASIAQIRDILETTIDRMHSLVFNLSPPVLHQLDLTAAVEWAGEKICRDYGLAFVYRDDGEPKSLDDERKVLLFRCVRELMMNTVKHAKATRLSAAMERVGELVRVTVEDDGRGFDLSLLDWRNHEVGFGLYSVREYLAAIGGQCTIESGPGCGTRVSLTVPTMRPL